jgi:hypothetical protein
VIVEVQIRGAQVRIRSEDDSVYMTAPASAPIRARMGGRTTAYFVATVFRGGGDKDWGDGAGPVRYEDPGDVVELGEALPDQGWSPGPRSVPPQRVT